MMLMIKVVLDMNTNMGMRLRNPVKQAAIVHPKARFLVYELRVEVQTEDDRNAKIYPRGISFTTNNMAFVYLLDEAGARSTSDMFHDLYATNIVDTLFEGSWSKEESGEAIQASIRTLDEDQYQRTEAGVDVLI